MDRLPCVIFLVTPPGLIALSATLLFKSRTPSSLQGRWTTFPSPSRDAWWTCCSSFRRRMNTPRWVSLFLVQTCSWLLGDLSLHLQSCQLWLRHRVCALVSLQTEEILFRGSCRWVCRLCPCGSAAGTFDVLYQRNSTPARNNLSPFRLCKTSFQSSLDAQGFSSRMKTIVSSFLQSLKLSFSDMLLCHRDKAHSFFDKTKYTLAYKQFFFLATATIAFWFPFFLSFLLAILSRNGLSFGSLWAALCAACLNKNPSYPPTYLFPCFVIEPVLLTFPDWCRKREREL